MLLRPTFESLNQTRKDASNCDDRQVARPDRAPVVQIAQAPGPNYKEQCQCLASMSEYPSICYTVPMVIVNITCRM